MTEKSEFFYKLVNLNNAHGWVENQSRALADMVGKFTMSEIQQFGDELLSAMRDGGFKAFCAKRRSVLNMGE